MRLLKSLFRSIGRLLGWFLYNTFVILKRLSRYILILLAVVILGILWLLGHVVLIFLTFLCSVFILFLKGFAWLTVKLLGITKDFGNKLGEYTECFFDGITDIFKKEKQELDSQLLTIKIETS